MDDTTENPVWQQFRMNSISSLVDECVEICHEEGIKASADVFPFPELARKYALGWFCYERRGQRNCLFYR